MTVGGRPLHPLTPGKFLRTLRTKRPCTRAHASSFSMSLRTSAHTGVAIRVPAEKLCKLAILRANLWRFSDSPKVLLFVLLYCEENGLSRRFAPRNDSGGRPLHPLTPGKFLRTLRAKRPCTRTHASSFSMSLRTSAHTGAAIRVPAEKLCKLAILRANLWRFSDSPKVLLFVLLYCEENGLPRRFAPRNDSGGRPLHPLTPGKFLRTLRTKRPCTRAHASSFSMSLRTSAKDRGVAAGARAWAQ